MTKENPRGSLLFKVVIMLLFNAFYSKAQEETPFTQGHWQNRSKFKFSTLPSLLYMGDLCFLGKVFPFHNVAE